MSQSSPPRLRITGQRRKVCRDGCTDILSQNQCCPQFETNPAVGAHNKRNGHSCRRCLHNHGQHRTDTHKKEYGDKAHVGIVLHK